MAKDAGEDDAAATRPADISYAEAVEAERRADLAREEACAPPAVVPHANEDLVRSRGRPATHPERAATVTFEIINALRRTARRLAQREEPLPPNELKTFLGREQVPLELHPAFRGIVGRHWRYLNKRKELSPKEARELATLAIDPMWEKPRETWSREDTKKSQRVTELQEKLHGRTATRLLDDQSALGRPDAGVLARILTPTYLRGLWKVLDQWGAARHGVPPRTFRSWREKLQKAGDLSIPPPPRKRVRHR